MSGRDAKFAALPALIHISVKEEENAISSRLVDLSYFPQPVPSQPSLSPAPEPQLQPRSDPLQPAGTGLLAPVPERAPAQHTTLLLGERVGVKEREQGGARGRHREDMGRKEKETQGVKTKEVRYFTPVAEEGHVFKTDEYRS
ncbi:hypothetical protein F7725_023162 [Dissostichus mawsoni]|uniref:Uncharacterized protein n=1 Tax=Dissostichus mawsoni TaxID=36200 RepID=A0A7J5Z2U6_DISMA|nr:hypothetical protein F7725_023162 [Dissostichus mawsoni]